MVQGVASPISLRFFPFTTISSLQTTPPPPAPFLTHHPFTPVRFCSVYAYGSQPCTPQTFNPMMPSTSRVPTPARPSSTMSARQYGSPFRAQLQNMEPSNSRVQELRDAAAGKKSYTNDWMNSSYMPPNGGQPQQQQYQRAPSMVGSTISNMSNMSQMSQMTTFSVLSVNTECGQFDNWIYNTQPALSRISSASRENHDPMARRERMSIQEICDNLRSTDYRIQAVAIRELEPPAKNKALELTYARTDLQQIIETLFEVLIPREGETDNVIRKTCEILHHVLMVPQRQSRNTDKIFVELNERLMTGRTRFQEQTPYSIYEIVMKRAGNVDKVYAQTAMVLLTHLCCKMYLMKRVFLQERPSDTVLILQKTLMTFLIQSLKSPDTKMKVKGFAVSIIKNLSSRNPYIKQMAQKFGIIRIFFDIMRNEFSDEDFLWPTMQALTAFCSDSANGNEFVSLGGAQVLCGLLSHGSARLLYELLGCMRKLADLPAIQYQDMRESIHNIIMLIGSDDPIIVERATGSLRNIGLHNKMNKKFMVQNGVTSHVLAVLRTSSRYTSAQPQPIPNVHQIMQSIYENCLSVLNNVTSMAPQDIIESARHACRMISENPDSADILLHYFNIGCRKFRKLAVTVMKRVIEAEPRFAEPFVDLRGTSNEFLSILLLKRAYESLEQYVAATAEAINSKLGPETPQRREIDERRRDHEDIVKRSMGLLTNLCGKANPRFFEALKDVLIDPRFGANPLIWLQTYPTQMSDNILQEWLAFIIVISQHPWSMQNGLLCWLIEQSSLPTDFFRTLSERRKNERITGLIMQLSNIFDQQSQLRHQKQMFMAQQQQQQHLQHQQNPM
ncbi:CBN-WRM-1 protein [Caenorhabditis brenneri]|uniref:CBN-WRM-1 protein n=1 Tax=Caenorhabditis brenneri TaxID=135651 RepID=G0MPG2_CAEBE|nr:CBN-WRM-1 protein [Caenorhabditis brenneri]